MINAIVLKSLRNPEFLQLMNGIAKIIEDNVATALNVPTQYAALKAKIAELQLLYAPERGSALTKDLELFDEGRDKNWTGITGVVEGFRYHFTSAKSEAANLLANHFKIFGTGIARQNYLAETGILKEIIIDLETKAELRTAVETLGITDWVAELKTVNTAFETKFFERNTETGAASPETILGKRQETEQAYYKLRTHLEANAVINEMAEPFQKTVNEVNAYIDSFNTLLNNRISNGGEEGNIDEGETIEVGDGEITPTTL
jgi:hypothetical protein